MAAAKAAKKIEVNAGNDTLTFQVGLDDYHRYQNEFLPDSKVSPSRNFLTRSVVADDKDKLEGLLDQGLAVDLATLVAMDYRPKLELSLKK